MNQMNWVFVWAKRRQDEVIRVPVSYTIHNDFFVYTGEDEVRSAFMEINTLFQDIYCDIAMHPTQYGMPLWDKNKYRVFSPGWRDSGQAPYRPFVLLYNLFTCGHMDGHAVKISIEKYKSIKPPPKHLTGISQKIEKPHFLFAKLADHGFVFDGLKNNRAIDEDIIISYPDNTALLHLLKQLADKAHYTNRIGDFLCCHFRLLQDDMKTAGYGFGADNVADRVHTEWEKEFCCKMDETLMSMGLFRKLYGGVECHGVAYYRSQKIMDANGPYSFRIITRGMDFENVNNEPDKMQLLLRIRNVEKCMAYLKTCPGTVKQIFTEHRDEGCSKQKDGSCKHGVSYEIGGKKYWRCACCHAPFNFKPVIDDIVHYIKLVDLGEKK